MIISNQGIEILSRFQGKWTNWVKNYESNFKQQQNFRKTSEIKQILKLRSNEFDY